MKNLVRRRLVDRMMDAYVDGREACVRVWDADQAWALARGPGSTAAFSRYTAALEQEEGAAESYAALVRRVDYLLGPNSTQRGAAATIRPWM